MAPTLSPATKRLAIFLLFSSIVVNVLLAFLPWTPASGETTGQPGRSPTQRITTLHHAAAASTFWTRRHVEDSWAAMLNTWEYRRAHPDTRLYEDLFFGKAGSNNGAQLKFQYPPSSLLFVEPIARAIPRKSVEALSTAQADAPRYAVLNAIGYLMLWANAGLVAMIFLRCGELAGVVTSLTDRRLRLLLALAATLTFYPIIKAFTLGQVQTWLNAGTALVVWCWITGRVCSAGMISAILCAIKPQYGVLLLWGVLRRRWGFVASFSLILTIIGGVSLAVHGLQNHLDYLRVLSHIAARGEGFFPNQSVNGLLNRFFHNGNNNTWDGTAFPPIHPVVRWVTLATSILLLLAAFMPMRRALAPTEIAAAETAPTSRRSVLDLLIVLLTTTMASPVAWEHHYGVLLPIFAVLAPAAMARGGRRVWWLAILYLIASNFWGLTRNLADGPFNVLQSTLFFAALGVLGWLYVERRAQSPA
jgi:alpha-1,2-mannosyltransferase